MHETESRAALKKEQPPQCTASSGAHSLGRHRIEQNQHNGNQHNGEIMTDSEHTTQAEAQAAATTSTQGAETLGFQSEVTELLNLMIHSLYSNREIFLRELVSNASDAIDKLRFLTLSDDSLFEGDPELRVEVSADTEARTLTVRDNGVGMNRSEVIENLVRI
jgi:hypothetical protein